MCGIGRKSRLLVLQLESAELSPMVTRSFELSWNISPNINFLTPNDRHSGRTAPLTSKRCIVYIYSTNTGIEYFKHGIYSPFFLFKIQFVS